MNDFDKILTEKQLNIYKKYICGKTVSEIARELNCSRQCVSQSIIISKRKIELLQSGYFEKKKEEKKKKEELKLKKKGKRERRKEEKYKRGKREVIMIDYKGETKTISEWCGKFGLEYHIVFDRFKRNWTPEQIFNTPVSHKTRTDYTLKENYDLSLISSEYLEILQRKNHGESFQKIADDLGQTLANVQIKAKAAINKLQGKEADKAVYSRNRYNLMKNNEDFLEKRREYSMRWYSDHIDQERKRSRVKNRKSRK